MPHVTMTTPSTTRLPYVCLYRTPFTISPHPTQRVP